MHPYQENPKTRGSGIVCCIPQTGECPNKCEDCFFQSGRSYLEPLADNLPNLPDPWEVRQRGNVVRVNDGNDSNVDRTIVFDATERYAQRFYNTAIPKELDSFPGPVVLTVNPGEMTDGDWHKVMPTPVNLMFVRFRVNTWNVPLIGPQIVDYYTKQGVPVILTFMAYFDTADKVPDDQRHNYEFRKRTLNHYYAITHEAWQIVMERYHDNPLVHSCGTEGVSGGSACKNCGNCLREYYATMERMRESQEEA